MRWQNKLALYIFLVIAGCEPENPAPIPLLSFQVEGMLTCYLETPCWNPVSTSIYVAIPVPGGPNIVQSGLLFWSTSDPSIADPDGSGHFQTKKEGTCTITVTQEASRYNAEASKSFTLVVRPKMPPTPVLTWSVNHDYTYYVGVGDSLMNPALTNMPSGGKITYTMSDHFVASVSDNGLIIGIKPGETTLTATQAAKDIINSAGTLTCKIVVVPRPVITFLNGAHITCTIGDPALCSNPWTTSITNGGYMTLYTPYYDGQVIAFMSYQGIIDPVRPGSGMVTVVQDASTVNSRGEASFLLTILPLIPVLSFEHGNEFLVSTINGPANNQVYANIGPDNTHYSFTSSNESLATINEQGLVTGLLPGTLTITVHLDAIANVCQAGSGSYQLRIIDYPIPNVHWATCSGGCNWACYLSDASPCAFVAVTNVPGGSPLHYSIDDTSIATVDPDTGVITKIKKGTTMITVTQEELPGVNGPGKLTSYLTIL